MRRRFFPKILLMLACLAGCAYRTDPETEERLNTPVVPQGFNVKLVDSLRCLQNGSKVHFATRRELDKINDRIGNFKVRKFDDGEPCTETVDAMLIREDGKIGYRVEKNEAILKIENALILDEKFK